MQSRTRKSRTHKATDHLTEILDALAARLVSDVLNAARRALEAARAQDTSHALDGNRHGVRRLRGLQRAIEWQLQIETGRVRSKIEIARREGITRSAVTQTLHLLDRLAQNEGAPLHAP